jgi:spermidine/putrescine transport system substrate-binding protein
MDTNDTFSALFDGRLTRRQLNQVLGSVGLGLVTIPFSSAQVSAAGEDPVVFTWAGYEVPEMHQSYIDKHNGSPKFAHFADQEEALTKIIAGYKPDVVHPCSQDVRKWRDAGIIKEIDTSRLKNWGDMWPDLRTLAETLVDDGKVWMVPVDWGNSSYCYRTDIVKDEESWNVLLDPRYKGKIAVYDGMDAVLSVALAIGITDPYHMTDEQLAQVKAKMVEQKELLRFYWGASSEYQQALASGEVVVSTCWNDGPIALQKQGVPVKMAKPKEGMITWVCGMVNTADGPGDEQKVYDYMDAMISAETGVFEVSVYGYGHSNQKAFEMVDAERLAELGLSNPAQMWKDGIFAIEGRPGLRAEWVTMLEEVKAGI